MTILLGAVIGIGLLMMHGEDRVAEARRLAGPAVQARFERAGLAYPPHRVFLRAFKQERELEVWAAPAAGAYRLVANYPIAAMSGKLGPKRREGDLQVPEGFYTIDAFNPQSRFLLSMRVSYPNASDRIRGEEPLGGDIYIHGSDRSIGCLAMTDPVIRELYLIELDARDRRRPVHVFPCRMTPANVEAISSRLPEHAPLWKELQRGYEAFERTRKVPIVKVLRDGVYSVR